MDLFAHDPGLISDELAEVRYRASTEPGSAGQDERDLGLHVRLASPARRNFRR